MKRKILLAGACALVISLPGLSIDCGRIVMERALAQTLAPPAPPQSIFKPEASEDPLAPATAAVNTTGEMTQSEPASLLSQLWLSITTQAPDLVLALKIALLPLVLIGTFLHQKARKQLMVRERALYGLSSDDEKRACRCGLTAAHCPWCKKENSDVAAVR